jgi:hypothetical protein
VPKWEKVYSDDGPASHASERPDALALTDRTGTNTNPKEGYYVEVQLVGEGAPEVWVQRHSITGLSMSPDGEKWTPIESLREAGIDELDAELNLVMPARLPHIRFGKDVELLRILSQIIGLDDLEAIADLAGRLVAGLRHEATRIKGKELVPEEDRIAVMSRRLAETKDAIISGLTSYMTAVSDKRTLSDVETFGKAMKDAIGRNRKQLATDLGIQIPEEDSEGFPEFNKQLENLPGQVQTAIDDLSKPLAQVFANSIGFSVPAEHELTELEQRLERFKRAARQQVTERLEWARKEKADAKASLMLLAATHFPEGSQHCPVCGQSLDKVPTVTKRLEELRSLACCSHLRANLKDLELRLLAELEKLVPFKSRSEAFKTLSERILSDWNALRARTSKGLLQQVVAGFDHAIEAMASQLRTESEPTPHPLAKDYLDEFPEAFVEVDEAIAGAKAYIQLCRSVAQSMPALSTWVENVLTAERRVGTDDSLRVVLERGKATNTAMRTLSPAYELTKQLYTHVKNKEGLQQTIEQYESWANVGDTLKELGAGVRSEVIRMVRKLDTRMKAYFRRLYDKEILELGMLTRGHAANPNVKDEINIYLRAGKQLVPIGPFCNAGRRRALVLSFVFALLDESSGTLGLTILDDPAVSLDDEHKAKLVNRVIGPSVGSKQVVLATHYEDFYRLAGRAFADGENLQMVPRRRVCDEVGFEPGDILERVERTLKANRANWRDQAASLRRWIERSLRTLSGYSPEQFWHYNDLVGTVNHYGRIRDERVVTKERDEIIAILSPDFIEDVRRLAHDEDAAEADFDEALKSLKTCKKPVDKEIQRFKKIYDSELSSLGIAPAPSLQILSLPSAIPPWKFDVVREAAAAHNGQGIEWDERESHHLEGHQVAVVMEDVISPIALAGQYLLLDSKDGKPMSKDLVAVETEQGGRYLRRFWEAADKTVSLEAINLTSPRQPVHLSCGRHSIRRVVGVLFEGARQIGPRSGDEWVPFKLPERWFANIVGLRIKGTSMEPLVRENQFVLVRRGDRHMVKKADLACVDIADVGTVIKHCYPSEKEWVLCSMNLDDTEDPMRVRSQDILHAYPLVGVLFEL